MIIIALDYHFRHFCKVKSIGTDWISRQDKEQVCSTIHCNKGNTDLLGKDWHVCILSNERVSFT